MQGDFAPVRTNPVLPEVDPLPSAQREAAAGERNRQLDRGQRGADMRGHVVGSFVAMPEQRVAIGYEASQEAFEISEHVGIGILLHDQTGGCVADEQRETTFARAGLSDKSFGVGRDIDETLGRGLDGQA